MGITACKKNKNNNNDVSPNEIVLDALKVSGNTVTLSWSKLNNANLYQYVIVRVVDSNDTTRLDKEIFLDKSITSYTDTLPLAPYVQYYVIADLNNGAVKSNKQTTTLHTDMVFLNMPGFVDALYDRAARKIYIYGTDGLMALYDVTTKTVTKQIKMNASIGFSALGNYNGNTELYVPRSDGWLFIYNAATLDVVDQIYIGSNQYLSTVVYNQQKLFITITTGDAHTLVDSILCYSRTTKMKLSSTGAYSGTGIRLVPGTNSDLFGVNLGQAYLYRFGNTGSLISQQSQDFSNYYLRFALFEVFPDGDKFINGERGVVIDKNLEYVTTLPYGNDKFTSFDFDNSNKLIYAGCHSKTVRVYAMSDYRLTRTINTQGYPNKIFYDNGTVLSVSVAEYDPHSYYPRFNYVFVEQL